MVETQSADIISTLLKLKQEVEEKIGAALKLTVAGGAEAHLLAKELGSAGVGVVVVPSRPFPYTWEHRRMFAHLFIMSFELTNSLTKQTSRSTTDEGFCDIYTAGSQCDGWDWD